MSPCRKQIAIVGAGPAGSVAAIALVQRGHSVSLFEKAKFPRDKVCGECLSSLGIGVLRRLGAADALAMSATPNVLRQATAVAVDGTGVTVSLPEPMWGLTRRTMDALLLNHALACGAAVEQEVAATVSGHGADGRPAVTRQRRGEPPMPAGAFDCVIIADGRGASWGPPQPTGDFGLKAHFRGINAPPDTIELIALPHGGYAGLAPVEGGIWNTAWSVPGELLKRHRGDIGALFDEQVRNTPALRHRFGGTSRLSEWLACPLPRYPVRGRWPMQVIPLGNAAAALEPVGGEGMGLAMRSAELTADAIDAAARTGQPLDPISLRRQFDRLWRRRRVACRAGALALSHPVWGGLAVGAAARSNALARIGLALVGK